MKTYISPTFSVVEVDTESVCFADSLFDIVEEDGAQQDVEENGSWAAPTYRSTLWGNNE